uniref:Uncharacterized protein n=1 Tax=Sphaerodactylus townsendi TaxID=933632 RepID=A0ACB8G7Q2_9SAUR
MSCGLVSFRFCVFWISSCFEALVRILSLFGKRESSASESHWLVLSFLFAIRDVNRNPNLLPNVTLGYSIYENYGSARMTYDAMIDLASSGQENIPNYSCGPPNMVLAVLENAATEISVLISNVIGIYKIPQMYRFLKNFWLSNTSIDGVHLDEDGGLAADLDIVKSVQFPNDSLDVRTIGNMKKTSSQGFLFNIEKDDRVWPRWIHQVRNLLRGLLIPVSYLFFSPAVTLNTVPLGLPLMSFLLHVSFFNKDILGDTRGLERF